MKLSPLQLERYFITDLHFSANSKFDESKEALFKCDYIEVKTAVVKDAKESNKWQITLNIKFQPSAEANIPYSYSLEMVGLFETASEFPADKVERLVKTNGSTMLYGVAREVVRELTSKGPRDGPVLPSVSFFEPEKKAQETIAATPEMKADGNANATSL